MTGPVELSRRVGGPKLIGRLYADGDTLYVENDQFPGSLTRVVLASRDPSPSPPAEPSEAERQRREMWDTPAPMDTIDDLPTLRGLPLEPSNEAINAAYAAYTELGEDNFDAVESALRAAYRIERG